MTRGRALACVGALVLLGMTATAARAFTPFELEAYPATTRGRGKGYIESFSTAVPRGRKAEDQGFATDDLVRTSVEFNYGIAEHVDLALYVDTAKPEHHDLRYAGTRIRLRGTFMQDLLPFDLGWYSELELPQRRFAEEDAALELRATMSRKLGRYELRLNPILEQPFNGEHAGSGPEIGYAARASVAVAGPAAIGVEGFGSFGPLGRISALGNGEHYVLPILHIRGPGGLEVAVGPGFGLTRKSDRLFVKLAIEWEFD